MSKKRILCIDDDQEILDALKLLLESRNYNVTVANSAALGLESYKKERPDFIIVDLMMEKVDSGTSFVSEITKDENKPPIYMLSGVGNDLFNTCDYRDLGLDGVFQKPIKPELLLGVINERLK